MEHQAAGIVRGHAFQAAIHAAGGRAALVDVTGLSEQVLVETASGCVRQKVPALVSAPCQEGAQREAALPRSVALTSRRRAASPGRDDPRRSATGRVVGQVEQVPGLMVVKLDQLAI